MGVDEAVGQLRKAGCPKEALRSPATTIGSVPPWRDFHVVSAASPARHASVSPESGAVGWATLRRTGPFGVVTTTSGWRLAVASTPWSAPRLLTVSGNRESTMVPVEASARATPVRVVK